MCSHRLWGLQSASHDISWTLLNYSLCMFKPKVWVFANHAPDWSCMTNNPDQPRLKVLEVPPMPRGYVKPFVPFKFSVGKVLTEADCKRMVAEDTGGYVFIAATFCMIM